MKSTPQFSFRSCLLLFILVFTLFSHTSYAQTLLPNKGIIWQLTKSSEPRLNFRFGTKGINIGGYEGTTLITENQTGSKLYVVLKLTFTDFCGGTKTNNISFTIKPNGKVGGDTWMGGSEQHDYKSTCTERKKYDDKFTTKIASVSLEIVSVKDLTNPPKNDPEPGGIKNDPEGGTKPEDHPHPEDKPETSSGNCPTFGFKFSNSPTYNCVALEWWSISTKVNTIDANGNFKQSSNPEPVSFTVQYRKQGSSTWTSDNREKMARNLYILKGLDACTDYEVRLITTCDNKAVSAPSNTVRFKTDCTPPPSLTIENVKINSAQVSSNRRIVSVYPCPPDETRIRVVEFKTGTGNWDEVICNSGSLCVLNGLLPGMIYRVRARYKFSNNIYSNYTNEVSFTTKGN